MITQEDLKQPYSRQSWQTWLGDIFGSQMQFEAQAENVEIDRDNIKSIQRFATVKLADGKNLAVLDIETRAGVKIARNRVGLHNLVKKFIDNDRYYGILAFYHCRDAQLCVSTPEHCLSTQEYRLSFISREPKIDADGKLVIEITASKRFTYLLGENAKTKTPADRLKAIADKRGKVILEDVKNAFSVETLTKEFFDKYKSHYQQFCNYLIGIQSYKTAMFNDDDKDIRDFCKKMMGRIVFLYFLQKKGWLGAKDNKYKDGDKDFISNLFKATNESDVFYSEWLSKLFFETLNKQRDNDDFIMPNGITVKIPFLNGGLFENDFSTNKIINFPKDLFKSLFEFLDQYNFTIYEDDPNDKTVAVDPEMLGHIFENLLEDNKDKGAFYTPKEIVHYMCQESLIEYIATATQEKQIDRKLIEKLIKKQLNDDEIELVRQHATDFNKILDEVKICDPAIGSGAFPMGLLLEIFAAKQALYHFEHGTMNDFNASETKLNIIQNSIYGVDIEKGAVDIARLRFWLSLIIDEELPKPLPNLDYKIVVGDSLVSKFVDGNCEEMINIDWDRDTTKVGFFAQSLKQTSIDLLNNITKKQRSYFQANINNKRNLASEIRLLKIDLLINQLDLMLCERNDVEPQRESYRNKSKTEFAKAFDDWMITEGLKRTKQRLQVLKNQTEKPFCFFDWKLDFPEVLNPYLVENKDKQGFDIVIGNPPYGAKLTKEEKELFKVLFDDVHMRTPDTFNYFISKSISSLLKERGIILYIVPNNLLFQVENTKTRNLLINTNHLRRVINLGDNTFENADVPTCIFIATKDKIENYDIAYSDERKGHIKTINFNHVKKHLAKNDVNKVPDLVIGVSSTSVRILKDIEKVSWKIDDIALEVASGISTGGDKIFRIPKQFAVDNNFEQEILKPVLVGGEIDKYKYTNTENLIIYTDRETKIDQYGNIKEYLLNYKQKLVKRSEAKAGIMPWFSLNRQRYKNLFEEEKIVMRQTSDKIRATFDKKGFYTLDSMLVFKISHGFNISYKYALILLNSKVNNFVYKNITQEEGRTFAQVKPQNVRKLFLPKISEKEQEVFNTLCDYLLFLNDENINSVNPRIGNTTLSQFFQEIADACVVELIYDKEMKQKNVDILKYVREEIKPIEHLEYETQQAREIFNVHYSWSQPENEIRNRMKIISLMCPDTAGIILSGYEED